MTSKDTSSDIEFVVTDEPPIETFCPDCGTCIKTKEEPPYECPECGGVF